MTQSRHRRARRRVQLHLQPLEREVLEGVRADDGADDGARLRADVAILPWFEDERPFQGLLGLLDWRRDGSLSALAREGVARGTLGEAVLLPARPGLPVERLVLLGCGPRTTFDADTALACGTRAAQISLGLRPASVVVAMPTGCAERELLESLFRGLLHGIDAAAEDDPEAVMTTQAHPWWVVVEERHLARLRRVLDGPLRAAAETSSSS